MRDPNTREAPDNRRECEKFNRHQGNLKLEILAFLVIRLEELARTFANVNYGLWSRTTCSCL